MENFALPTPPSNLVSEIYVPGSKSETNRAYVLGLLANKAKNATSSVDNPIKTIIRNPLVSRDTELMLSAVTNLGAKIIKNKNNVVIFAPKKLQPGIIDCGLAGTLLRFLPPIALLIKGKTKFYADNQAQHRPIKPLLTSLMNLGAFIDKFELPFTITSSGNITKNKITIDASKSSQFISGLLLAGTRYNHGILIEHKGSALPSRPHIDLTIQMLVKAGVQITKPSENSWLVPPGKMQSNCWNIAPDLTNAAVFCAAAAICSGKITIKNWPLITFQPGDQIINILKAMGINVVKNNYTENYCDLTVTGTGKFKGIDIDMSDIGELAPTIVALAATAQTPSIIKGIAHLKGHETDRITALTKEINNLGGNCNPKDSGLIIHPIPLKSGVWHTYHDHRMATTAALIGLRYPGIIIENINTTAKTFPKFKQCWKQLLAQTKTIVAY